MSTVDDVTFWVIISFALTVFVLYLIMAAALAVISMVRELSEGEQDLEASPAGE